MQIILFSKGAQKISMIVWRLAFTEAQQTSKLDLKFWAVIET